MTIELIFFIIIIGIMVISVVREIIKWKYNNKQPQNSFEVSIIAKRDSGMFSRRGGRFYLNLTIEYYITFKFLHDGSKKEFCLSSIKGEKIKIGDSGILTLQGTRYIGFEKQN